MRPVVVKPANGIMGRNVFVGVHKKRDFLAAFETVSAADKGKILVEKFYEGVEHRCLVVDRRLIAVTRRRPASVLGDGVHSVAELVELKNVDRGPIHLDVRLDDSAEELLSRSGMTPDSIPGAGQRIFLRSTSNLHQGGDALDATDELSAEEAGIAESVARAIPGARCIGVDILFPREPGQGTARVIEVNTNPMVSMHHFPYEGQPRNVAGAIIDAMFPSTKDA